MRTDEERLNFCGTATMAARRLGIYARWEGDAIRWFDPSTRLEWPCTSFVDHKLALEAACESLINYLNGQKTA